MWLCSLRTSLARTGNCWIDTGAANRPLLACSGKRMILKAVRDCANSGARHFLWAAAYNACGLSPQLPTYSPALC